MLSGRRKTRAACCNDKTKRIRAALCNHGGILDNSRTRTAAEEEAMDYAMHIRDMGITTYDYYEQ